MEHEDLKKLAQWCEENAARIDKNVGALGQDRVFRSPTAEHFRQCAAALRECKERLAQAREDALEEAAKVCDEEVRCWVEVKNESLLRTCYRSQSEHLAVCIRALKHTGEDGETKR